MHNLLTLLPVIIFLIALLLIGFKEGRNLKKSKNFQKDYFVANRSLGGIVLAMTLVATYGSVSSFVSGPGVAWNLGFGWVVFAAPQIITGFILLGIVGKRLAIISRKVNALTIIDILHARYQSKFLSILLSLVILVFFTAMVIGQFVGGAQIFSSITGFDYKLGLLIFALVTVIYTSSGFKAVVITDTICAFLMLLGMGILFYIILEEGHGFTNVMDTIAKANLNKNNLSNNFDVNAGGALPFGLLFSAWLLVGFCTLGLPQSLVRTISYKSTQDLHLAMLLATIVCGALMIGMTFLGVLARGVITQMPENGTDAIIPLLVAQNAHPIIAGLTILGPLAATMSTVSSLLISASSAIIRDLMKQAIHDPYKIERFSSKKITSLITLIIGIIAIYLALYPMDIVVWINMFAFGGLESAFLWPVILGLFSKRMNAGGAILGVVLGLTAYIAFMLLGIKIGTWHNILVGTVVGFIFSIIGALICPKTNHETLKIFFPHRIKD